MITRVNHNFILQNELLDLDTLVVKANMEGYPYFKFEDNIYFVKSNNKRTKIRHVLVTDKIEEV